MTFEDLFFGQDDDRDTRLERLDDSADDLSSRYHELKRRYEGLGLLVEALVWYLEEKQGLDRSTLRLMVQRLDLADGKEDARIGPDRTASAAKCGNCGYPLNPKRTACLYCGIEEPEPVQAPPRLTECVSCHEQTPEAKAYITMTGLLCSTCFAVRESGVSAGNLSLAPDDSAGALSNLDTAGALSDPVE